MAEWEGATQKAWKLPSLTNWPHHTAKEQVDGYKTYLQSAPWGLTVHLIHSDDCAGKEKSKHTFCASLPQSCAQARVRVWMPHHLFIQGPLYLYASSDLIHLVGSPPEPRNVTSLPSAISKSQVCAQHQAPTRKNSDGAG